MSARPIKHTHPLLRLKQTSTTYDLPTLLRVPACNFTGKHRKRPDRLHDTPKRSPHYSRSQKSIVSRPKLCPRHPKDIPVPCWRNGRGFEARRGSSLGLWPIKSISLRITNTFRARSYRLSSLGDTQFGLSVSSTCDGQKIRKKVKNERAQGPGKERESKKVKINLTR